MLASGREGPLLPQPISRMIGRRVRRRSRHRPEVVALDGVIHRTRRGSSKTASPMCTLWPHRFSRSRRSALRSSAQIDDNSQRAIAPRTALRLPSVSLAQPDERRVAPRHVAGSFGGNKTSDTNRGWRRARADYGCNAARSWAPTSATSWRPPSSTPVMLATAWIRPS